MLNYHDLVACITRLPKELHSAMQDREFAGKVFIAGGFIRSVITGEPVNDIDLFLTDKSLADKLAIRLMRTCPEVFSSLIQRLGTLKIHTTDNAHTLRAFNPVIQIIRNREYKDAYDVVHNFDFAICAAAFYWHPTKQQWASLAHGSFYRDLAAKRLTYLQPHLHDNASGSVLRVLKFYRMGYSIPVESLGGVLARLITNVNAEEHEIMIKQELVNAFRNVDGRLATMEVGHMAAERLRSSGGSYEGEEDEPSIIDERPEKLRIPKALLAESTEHTVDAR